LRGGKRRAKEEPRPNNVQRKCGEMMDYIMGNSPAAMETRTNPRADTVTKP